ncbi:hypothetical protein PanWU01x14_230260, partial [Parasponia andersonii]
YMQTWKLYTRLAHLLAQRKSGIQRISNLEKHLKSGRCERGSQQLCKSRHDYKGANSSSNRI